MIPWHGLIPYFNPLPRKEGDIVHLNDAWNNRGHFNPLPRKEGDTGVSLPVAGERISIHSLVKRETFYKMSTGITKYNFNPLPRKEGDIVALPSACE